jgi:ribonuclease P protein subunit RPR2
VKNQAELFHKPDEKQQKHYEQRLPFCLVEHALPSQEGQTSKMNSGTRQIAKQRIQILFQQAEEARRENPQLASRYVAVARKIAMAAKIRLPPQYKRRICKNCNALLVPGENCRVRVKQRREPHVVVTCFACGHQTRVLLRKKKGGSES